MADIFTLSPETITRLQRHAKPFVDTVDSVVNRILDAYEGSPPAPAAASGHDRIRGFDPETPPNLTHTKMIRASLNGKILPPEEATWNGLLLDAVRLARKKVQTREQFERLVLVNFAFGKKEVDGYKYLSDIDISVQGQDANSAWRAIYHIVKHLELEIQVEFIWRDKPEAQFPGVTGLLTRRNFRRV